MKAKLKLLPLWYSLGALMLVCVAVLSLIPAPDTGVNDKLSHLLAYGVMSAWFSLLVVRRCRLIWIVVGLVSYGASIELLQGMTPDRYAEWGDLLANSVGILLGIILYFTPLRRILELVDRRLSEF